MFGTAWVVQKCSENAKKKYIYIYIGSRLESHDLTY